jgi:hypothetical protein
MSETMRTSTGSLGSPTVEHICGGLMPGSELPGDRINVFW